MASPVKRSVAKKVSKPSKPKKWIQAGKDKGTIREGGFHKTLGKKADAPITAADIARGKRMGGKARKQAVLAENFKKMARKRKKG